MHKPSELRLERLRVGVSGRELAKALRVSYGSVYLWERGERRIPEKMREKIRKYLLTKCALGG